MDRKGQHIEQHYWFNELNVRAGVVASGAFVGPLEAVHGVHMHSVIGAVLVDVRRTTVPGDVHSRNFVLGGDAQQVESLQQPEEGHHGGCYPARDYQDFDDLRSQQLAAASHEQPVGPVASAAVDLQNVVLLGEEAHEDQPPGAASAVQLGGFQRIVVVQASWRMTETAIIE